MSHNELHETAKALVAPMGAVVLVRPGASGRGGAGMERRVGEREGGGAGLPPPREDEFGRAPRYIHAGDGARSRRCIASRAAP